MNISGELKQPFKNLEEIIVIIIIYREFSYSYYSRENENEKMILHVAVLSLFAFFSLLYISAKLLF